MPANLPSGLFHRKADRCLGIYMLINPLEGSLVGTGGGGCKGRELFRWTHINKCSRVKVRPMTPHHKDRYRIAMPPPPPPTPGLLSDELCFFLLIKLKEQFVFLCGTAV
jgi:hypothetical protein